MGISNQVEELKEATYSYLRSVVYLSQEYKQTVGQ